MPATQTAAKIVIHRELADNSGRRPVSRDGVPVGHCMRLWHPLGGFVGWELETADGRRLPRCANLDRVRNAFTHA